MSTKNNSIREFEASLQVPPPPPTNDHETAAKEKVAQLGDNPTTAQMTTLMVTMLNQNRHETQQLRDKFSHHLLGTMHTVAQHDTDIAYLKEDIKTAGETATKVSSENADILKRLAVVEVTTVNTNKIAAENKQRSCKGTFILSGDIIPRPSPSESLYQLLFPVIYQKYGIYIYLQELKALHRLPNNRVLFTVHTLLPGHNFDNLMRAVNSNPLPHIHLYVTMQLMPPYKELYFIARRLKYNQLIQRYRIDDNGVTHISLAENLMSFKFTGFEQLRQLSINIPQSLYEEVENQATQIKENEAKSIALNTSKARQEIPNFVPRTSGLPKTPALATPPSP